MPKRKRPVEKPKDQFKRFVEAAKNADVDTASAEKAFSKVTKEKAKTSSHRDR